MSSYDEPVDTHVYIKMPEDLRQRLYGTNAEPQGYSGNNYDDQAAVISTPQEQQSMNSRNGKPEKAKSGCC